MFRFFQRRLIDQKALGQQEVEAAVRERDQAHSELKEALDKLTKEAQRVCVDRGLSVLGNELIGSTKK